MRKFSKYIMLLVSVLWISSSAYAQWDIPAEYKEKEAPTESSAELISLGQQIYVKNCQSCHGEPTKNNALPLNPPPPDLGNADYIKTRTAGENFYQLETGLGGMPSFKNTLTEDERWNVIHYFRSFGEGTVQVEKIKLDVALQADAEKKEIVAMVTKIEDGQKVPVSDVKLNFFVKRYFGQLPIGEGVTTNSNGYASAKYPADLKGTEDGKATVLVGFSDSFIYGENLSEIEVGFAPTWEFQNPLDKPNLWGPNTSAPVWLILMYSLTVIGVWLVIFYVVFQIIRIRKAA